MNNKGKGEPYHGSPFLYTPIKSSLFCSKDCAFINQYII